MLEIFLGEAGRRTLGEVPAFAIMLVDDYGAQVAVRGSVTVSARAGPETREISGEGVMSWREESLAAPHRLAARVDGSSPGRKLELACGVVMAAEVSIELPEADGEPAVGVRAADRPAAEALTPIPRAEPWAGADDDQPEGQTTLAPEMTTAAARLGEGSEPPEDQAGDHKDLEEMLYGTTRIGGAEFAAVREEDDQPLASTHAPGGSAGEEELEHDGLTVLKPRPAASAPPGTGRAAPAVPDSSSVVGVPVLGRRCPCATANPPRLTHCRACGKLLEGDALALARPALGQALLSTAVAFDLDRPLVIGRRPRSARFSSTAVPRLVTVLSPSQDISRSHLMVELEDWSVLVSDLGTTNGTVLRRAGFPDRRLQSKENVLAKNGDVFELGDGVTVTFRGLP
jgi:hypothetical protein